MSTFGEELRRERELRQIELREVAQATKVNLRYLEAMERNDFSHLPGGVFNRGFVRAYCQFIGVDPEAMVNAYIQEEEAQREAVGETRERGLLRGPGHDGTKVVPESPQARRHPFVRWSVVALAALVLAGSIYVLYLRFARESEGSSGPGSAAGRETRLHDDRVAGGRD